MHLDLNALVGGVIDVERRYPPSSFAEAAQDYRVVDTVEVRLRVQEQGVHYAVTGHVTAPLELACGRCLEPFPWTVDADVDLLYVPEAEGQEGSDRELEADDFTVATYRDRAIDLGELLHEQFLLAMPMKPLCKADCQGLCPVCGKNRNRESCACQPHWDDPRLAALRQFVSDRPRSS
ncbi:MAG: DUF177 domain-containing protein [Vicinamibacterales bacterium]